MKQINSKRIVWIIIATVIAFAVGLKLGALVANSQKLQVKAATIFEKPRVISPFKLQTTAAKEFTQKDLLGHWTLMFFGFTNCPDICPTTLSILNQVYQTVEKKGIKPPQVVFVSVDPGRDHLDKLASYVPYFNPNFIGATGAPNELKSLAQQLGVMYQRIDDPKLTPEQQKKSYLVDHSGTIVVFNPQGQYFAVFSMPHQAPEIAQDMINITQHYE